MPVSISRRSTMRTAEVRQKLLRAGQRLAIQKMSSHLFTRFKGELVAGYGQLRPVVEDVAVCRA
jgi:hypothetical protein